MSVEPSLSPVIYDSWDVYARYLNGSIPQDPNVIGSFCSCGVSMLVGVSHVYPQEIVDKILKQRASTDKKFIKEAFVLFSDTDHNGKCGGNALCIYIRENKLGDILEMGPRKNPNTGNRIKFWVWAPPHKSLEVEDRFMPVYGKIMSIDGHGNPCYRPDPRFQDSRGSREA